jgi:hypothetical protein
MDNPRAVNGPVVDKIFVMIPLVPNKVPAVDISANDARNRYLASRAAVRVVTVADTAVVPITGR